MAKDYSIQLGIDLKVNDIRKRINEYNKNANNVKLKLGIDLDTNDLKKQISQLNLGSKGVAIPINTQSLETSFKEVKTIITDIKSSLGTIDNKSGMKSLLSSVNQISAALEKTSKQFESLNANLNALSGKDLNLNLGINLGGSNNPIGRNAAYGSKVRNETLPQLKKQAAQIEAEIQKYYQKILKNPTITNDTAFAKLIGGTNVLEKTNVDIYEMYGGMSATALKTQIESYKQYINIMSEAAKIKNIDLSSVTSGFTKSADQLVQDAVDVQTGANEMQEGFEKLKQIFGGGSNLNVEGISQQLDSIVVDLGEIKTALQALSTGDTLGGLTTSFDKLSASIEKIVQNCANMKVAVSDSVGGINGSVGQASSGLANVESNMAQVTATVKNADSVITEMGQALNNFGVNSAGIDAATSDIREMGIEVQKIKTTIDGSNLKVSITGIQQTVDGLSRIVTETKEYKDVVQNTENVNRTFTQTFKTSADVLRETQKRNAAIIKELNQEASGFVKMRSKIVSLRTEIGSLELLGGNENQIANKKRQLEELDITYDRLMDSFREKLFANADIMPFSDVIKFMNEIAAVTDKAEGELNSYNAKLADTKAKVATKIQGNFSGYDDSVNKLESEFGQLSLQSDEVRDGITSVKNALQTLKSASTVDEVIGAYERFEQLLKNVNAQLNIAKRTDTRVKKAESVEGNLFKHDSSFDKVETDFSQLLNKSTELTAAMGLLKTKLQEMHTAVNSGDIEGAIKAEERYLQILKDVAAQLDIAKRADVDAKKAQGIRDNFGTNDLEVTKLETSIGRLSNRYPDLEKNIKDVNAALAAMKTASSDDELIAAEERYQQVLKETQTQLEQYRIAEQQVNRSDNLALGKEKAMSRLNNMFGTGSQAAKKFAGEIDRIQREIAECGNEDGLKKINKELDNLNQKSKGYNKQTFGQSLKEQFSKYSSYFSVASLFMYASQGLRDMFEQVKAIDTAMTELKKVTDETDASYNKFLSNAASRAKKLGTTIDGLVESTADFARLGYGFEDAQGLAEVANIYAVVGDEINGVEGATESLISTMAAFKQTQANMSNSEFAMDIVDKFNEVDILAS